MADDSDVTRRNPALPRAPERRRGGDRRRVQGRGGLANMRFAFNRRRANRRHALARIFGAGPMADAPG